MFYTHQVLQREVIYGINYLQKVEEKNRDEARKDTHKRCLCPARRQYGLMHISQKRTLR